MKLRGYDFRSSVRLLIPDLAVFLPGLVPWFVPWFVWLAMR